MTERTTATCAVCGNEAPVAVQFAPPEPAAPADFDTRPGEPLRSTIGTWVQSCPHCGYCAEDISAAPEGMGEIIQSPEYRALQHDASIPVQARAFLCFATVLERLHHHADAGWSALHAAWVCDDEEVDDAAARCRARAIEYWRNGKAAGQQFADDLASEFALATDVYRRIGQFENATVTCAEGLDIEDIPPILEQLLRRQTVLIQRRDTSAHSMSELMHQRSNPEEHHDSKPN